MIPKTDVAEAAAVVRLAVDMLARTSNSAQGLTAAGLRLACGDLQTNAEVYIVSNQIAAKLGACFDQARTTGATLDQFNRIRAALLVEPVVSLVATLILNSCICYSLQQMSLVIVAATFTSREDVDAVRIEIGDAFSQAEEVAADEMVLLVYRKLIALHAAVMFHLYETARPLPQMLDFEFAAISPTLVQAYKLYTDASRCDELREENKVIHPAFAPMQGRALSF